MTTSNPILDVGFVCDYFGMTREELEELCEDDFPDRVPSTRELVSHIEYQRTLSAYSSVAVDDDHELSCLMGNYLATC
jgi:hypothetical protein